jgi:hypothetical protein
MNVLAIDPGPTQSAYVLWDGTRVIEKSILPNDWILRVIRRHGEFIQIPYFCIEMISHYGTGMPIGDEVIRTCIWIGRFIECWPGVQYELIKRQTIKTHLCGSPRANDGNVRQALIDRLGKPGTKHEPGVTYGVTTHLWSALAVAVCAYDRLMLRR